MKPRRSASCSSAGSAEEPKVTFDVINQLMTKKEISKMIDHGLSSLRSEGDGDLLRRIMALGFYNAFKAGISFGKDDMVIPENQVEDRRRHPRAREGLRAAVQ
jgi:hypothetical protein